MIRSFGKASTGMFSIQKLANGILRGFERRAGMLFLCSNLIKPLGYLGPPATRRVTGNPDMTEKTFAKKVNAQRSAERQAAKTGTLYKVEAVDGGYTVVAVAGDTAPAKAPAKGKPPTGAKATTPPPSAPAPAAVPVKARPQAQGKAPAEVGKLLFAGTNSAAILALLLEGGHTLMEIGELAKVPACKAGVKVETQSRIWSLWRHNGIGYSIDADGRYSAILPGNLTPDTCYRAPKLPTT
jgi:hypothetical protein